MPVFNVGVPVETQTPAVEVTSPAANPLPPGAYTFQLEVIDNDGLVSEPVKIQVMVNEGTVTVPNLLNLPADQAKAIVAQIGLGFVVTDTQIGNAPANRVLSQVPASGTVVPLGTAVSVILSIERVGVLVGVAGPEPDTLFWPATSMLAAEHILEALYDGPYDAPRSPLRPDHLPVILAEPPRTAVQLVPVPQGAPRVSNGMRLTNGPQTRLNQLTAVFSLRDDLRWADGKPVTTRDLLFAFELIRQSTTPISKFRTSRTASFEPLDDFTIQWQGLPGWIDPHPIMNLPTPLPAHLLDGMRLPEILDTFGREPIGYGPFVLREWQAGNQIALEKHPFYFRANEGLPRTGEILLPQIDDSDQIVTGLTAGELDFALTGSLSFTNLPQLQAMAAAGELTLLLQPGNVQEYLFFNFNNGRFEFFHDPRIRQAIAFALDRKRIVEELWQGNATLASSYLAPDHPFFMPDLPDYPFDPDRALQLLEEAGFANGLGETVTLLLPAGRDDRLKMAEVIRESLFLLGLELDIVPVTPNKLFAKGPRTPLFGQNFEMVLCSWTADFATAAHLFLCEEISGENNGFGGRNFSGYCDKEFDAITLAALATNDRNRWFQSQQFWADRLPAIPLFQPFKLAAKRPLLKPFTLLPLQPSEMTRVEEMA